ncbi:MAG: TolC family protein [Fimbriiglobus sp.]
MTRKRWTMRRISACLLVGLLGTTGCKSQLLKEPADYDTALNNGLTAKLTTAPHELVAPTPNPSGAPPLTVLNTNAPPRPMSLKEAIAIGMEGGNVGGPSTNPGNVNDQLPGFTGRGTTGTDSIKAFAIAPAIAAVEIERSLSKFDARFISSLTWNNNDQPTLSLQQSFSNGDSATLSTALAKPLPTGGVAGITFSTQYQKLSQPPSNREFVALNSSYTPRLQFTFEQPLLQSFGIEANQLNANHPGSLLIPGFRSTGQGTEGILLTRVRFYQQRAEFDRQINTQLLNIEAAYWNLYAAYYNLAAQENAVQQALDAYWYVKTRATEGIERKQFVDQLEASYWGFRVDMLNARDQVLRSERNLRGLLGMRSNDGSRIVPSDEPTLGYLETNMTEIFQEASVNRPELILAREEVKAQQLNVMNQKNLRRPDLRLLTSYDIAGLGPRLDGAGDQSALRNFSSNQFNSWQVGLRFEMPIGFRDAGGLVQQAVHQLNSSFHILRDAERKTDELIIESDRVLKVRYQQILFNRSQRVALENQLAAEQKRRKEGALSSSGEVLNITQLQQNLARATSGEYRAIADYNIAIASLEAAKGTIQRFNNVSVSEGPLPAYVQKKAADHFAAREAAIKLREHPAELPLPALPEFKPSTDPINGIPGMPLAPSLPMTPATPMPPSGPTPMSMGTGVVPGPLPQMVPADAGLGNFTASGSVTLPTRNRPTLPLPTPTGPTTPVSTGTGTPR